MSLDNFNNSEDLLNIGLYEMGFSLIVPVPDMIDPRSAGKMLQKVMQEIDRRRYRKVVIDISAVSVLDRMSFKILQDIAKGAELMGARTVFIGVQPGVASAMVELVADVDTIVSAPTLNEGLAILEGNHGNG